MEPRSSGGAERAGSSRLRRFEQRDEREDAAPAIDFPTAKNTSIEQLAAMASPTDIQFAPSGKVVEPGKNRYGFAAFDSQGQQQTDLDVALYATSGPKSKVLGTLPGQGRVARNRTFVSSPDHLPGSRSRQGGLRRTEPQLAQGRQLVPARARQE